MQAVRIAALLVSTALASGCQASSSSAGNSWTKHGTLRIGVVRDIDNINPMLSGQSAANDVAQMVFSGLLDWDAEGNQIPDVALAVPTRQNGGISADGRTITYHLRHGVRFTDGQPLTAADAVYTWHAMLDPKHNVAYRFPYDSAVSVNAPDPYTIVVRLRSPSAPFISYFLAQNGRGAILPKHLLEHSADFNRDPYNRRPIGSGPFTVKSWQPGVKLELAANPGYWRGKPKLDRIDLLVIPHENSLLSELQSHDIDLYYDVSKTHYAQVRALAGTRVSSRTSANFEHIDFNCARPPFDDVRVRRAVAYAIDWKSLAAKVYRGIGADGMTDITPGSWADAHVAGYPRDLVRARSLLAQAGWRPGTGGGLTRNGVPLAIDISTVAGVDARQNAEVLIQQNLREIGIAVQVRNYPASLLFSAASAGGILNGGKFGLALSAWDKGPEVDDSNTIGPDKTPPNGGNSTFYRDPQIGSWLQHATSTYDRAQRRPWYAKVQQRVHDTVPRYTIIWPSTIIAYNGDLKGLRPANAGSDYWNSWEWSI